MSPRPFANSVDSEPTVAIVGGGFSGSMCAAQILRRAKSEGPRVRVALIERSGTIGEGLAYSTRDPAHLLNVPAGRMSAWPDRPDDLVRWISQRFGPVSPTEFLPREWYGAYVRDTLLTIAQDAGDSAAFSLIHDDVRQIARHPSRNWTMQLASGDSLDAEAVILAVGHRPPTDPTAGIWTGSSERLIVDPWRPAAMERIASNQRVIVLGTGLTAVDASLSLSRSARQAPITLLSRNGLLPQSHSKEAVAAADLQPLVSALLAQSGGVRILDLFRALRRRAREAAEPSLEWRGIVDGLRSHTAALWKAMPTKQRRRFLARLRPFWEVHRHRMPPPIAERFMAMRDRGEVRVVAGRVVSARGERDGVQLVVRERNGGRIVNLDAGWVINCTGPAPANSASANPAVGSLLAEGWVRADAIGLGVETSADGHAIDSEGRVVDNLFVIGTLRKADLWESTAVPELRNQAAMVADRILNSLIHRSAN